MADNDAQYNRLIKRYEDLNRITAKSPAEHKADGQKALAAAIEVAVICICTTAIVIVCLMTGRF